MTHFNPKSHPPGSSAAGFHTPKGQHAQDTSCQFSVAVSHWPGDCGTTWTRDCIDFLSGPRTKLNGRPEKRKERALTAAFCASFVLKKASRQLARQHRSAAMRRDVCARVLQLPANPQASRKEAGLSRDPDHLHAAQTFTGIATHTTVVGL